MSRHACHHVHSADLICAGRHAIAVHNMGVRESGTGDLISYSSLVGGQGSQLRGKTLREVNCRTWLTLD